MKINKIEDLVENHYYKLKYHITTNYIKYYYYNNKSIYFYWEIRCFNNDKPFFKYLNTLSLAFRFDEYMICEEVEIDELIEYLPENNIDKINYLRKRKIKNLLCEIKN